MCTFFISTWNLFVASRRGWGSRSSCVLVAGGPVVSSHRALSCVSILTLLRDFRFVVDAFIAPPEVRTLPPLAWPSRYLTGRSVSDNHRYTTFFPPWSTNQHEEEDLGRAVPCPLRARIPEPTEHPAFPSRNNGGTAARCAVACCKEVFTPSACGVVSLRGASKVRLYNCPVFGG